MKVFDGIDNADFDCPHGIAWHNGEMAKITGKTSVAVAPELLAMDFLSLFDMVMRTEDDEGISLANREKDLVESAECTECRKNKSASILRVWLSKSYSKAGADNGKWPSNTTKIGQEHIPQPRSA